MSEFEVLSRTQRLVVTQKTVRIVVDKRPIKIISGGTPGIPGLPGLMGPTGPQGLHGPHRFYGDGPPGTIIGAQPQDEYVDRLTGDLYTLL